VERTYRSFHPISGEIEKNKVLRENYLELTNCLFLLADQPINCLLETQRFQPPDALTT
jgi:hypothetical protein